eukprot:4279191-Alexandrium_andersonii.AAC.1
MWCVVDWALAGSQVKRETKLDCIRVACPRVRKQDQAIEIAKSGHLFQAVLEPGDSIFIPQGSWVAMKPLTAAGVFGIRACALMAAAEPAE